MQHDPNEWCLKNGHHSGCLNPGPLDHESSALTTRPQPLALVFEFFVLIVVVNISNRQRILMNLTYKIIYALNDSLSLCDTVCRKNYEIL